MYLFPYDTRAGLNKTGITLEQNAAQFWSIAIHIWSCVAVLYQYTGACKCTENQVVKDDFALHIKCLMLNAAQEDT